MRKHFFLTIFFLHWLFSPSAMFAQNLYLNFDLSDTIYSKCIFIDTVNYHHNIWQIGKPQKVIFDSALSLPNVLITDTLHPCRPDDTSVFTMKLPTYMPWPYGPSWLGPIFEWHFNYKLDIDTNAIASIEISLDTGHHWINIQDSLPLGVYWTTGIHPSLSESTIGWANLRLGFSLTPSHSSINDTILFRFTFISNSTVTAKEGWMIDNFNVFYWFESVSEVNNPNLISLYPNPIKGNIYLKANKQLSGNGFVAIYDMLGRQVYPIQELPPDGHLKLQLPDGIYILKYYTVNEYCIKRITISN